MAVEDLRKATYSYMCVNGSEDREPMWSKLDNIISRELSLCKRGTQVVQRLPVGTTDFTVLITLTDDPRL